MSAALTKEDPVTPFEKFLHQYDEEAWATTVTTLLPAIHEVDKAATQIWFRFYPLGLFQALQKADDPDKLARQLLLQGNYRLASQIVSSHRFLYGHRYWPEVKKAVAAQIDSLSDADAMETSLPDQILAVARGVADELTISVGLVVGVVSVAFMTVRQAGSETFKAAPGKVLLDAKEAKKSPEQVIKERARDDSQGLLGFLKTVDKKWSVIYDENDRAARYKLNNMQDLASGAAGDCSRDWRALDPRRIEGPIPVECRSASCGTCWVGVLGGAEKLSEVASREGTQIKLFGYIETAEPKPLIRLACQAQANGAVSIVIPPWNGVFGKYLHGLKEGDPRPNW